MADAEADLDLVLERAITAPMTARAAVRTLLSGPGPDAGAPMLDDAFSQLALLATSEIVTHSLTRGTGSCQLRAWHASLAGWLRVEVIDRASSDLPHGGDALHVEADQVDDVESLRLAVLLEVASAWGVDHSPFGRTTWFEIAR